MRLLATTRHVVDEGTVDVGATDADGIEEVIVIRHFVLSPRWSSGRTLQSQKEFSALISSLPFLSREVVCPTRMFQTE